MDEFEARHWPEIVVKGIEKAWSQLLYTPHCQLVSLVFWHISYDHEIWDKMERFQVLTTVDLNIDPQNTRIPIIGTPKNSTPNIRKPPNVYPPPFTELFAGP